MNPLTGSNHGENRGLQAWLSRLGISLVPVFIVFVRILGGYDVLGTIATAVGTYAYLGVVVQSENLRFDFVDREEAVEPSDVVFIEILRLLVALLLWIGLFMIAGWFRDPVLLSVVAPVAIAFSALILRGNYTRYGIGYAAQLQEIEEKRQARIEARPDDVNLGGKKIDL